MRRYKVLEADVKGGPPCPGEGTWRSGCSTGGCVGRAAPELGGASHGVLVGGTREGRGNRRREQEKKEE